MSEQKKKSDENFDKEKCTSHCILFEWLGEKKNNAKLLVNGEQKNPYRPI